MGNRINEVKIIKSEIIPIDKKLDMRLIDVYKSICKITYEIGKDKVENGSGFLIKLPKDGEEIYCLMTNHHVITKEMIDSKKTFKVEYEFRKKSISIKLDPNGKRFIKSDKTLDFTIIEVDDLIGKEYFLSPDTKNINYQNKDIYIIQYPGGDKLGLSEGKIIRINNYDELVHDASTKSGSSGSPIFLKDKTEVIGIHKAGSNRKEENYGTLINSIIQFIQSKNDKSKKSNENISIIKDNQKNEILCIYNKKEDEIDLLHDYSLNINNFDELKTRDIYIPQYFLGENLTTSSGKIKGINNNEFTHLASTTKGSSGSPILLKDTTEIIWIHKQGNTKTRKENYGTLINSIIEFIQSKNNKSKKSNENISIIKDNQKNEIICIYNKQKDEIDLLYNYSRDIYRR